MKKYRAVQICISDFSVDDVVRTSFVGEYEGVNDLDPTTTEDWFVE